MLKIIKKNQLTILVISLMLVTAGYLNYNENIQTSTEIADILLSHVFLYTLLRKILYFLLYDSHIEL